jgi:hypothetical protein
MLNSVVYWITCEMDVTCDLLCWITTILACMLVDLKSLVISLDYRSYMGSSARIWSLRWLFLYLCSYNLDGSVTLASRKSWHFSRENHTLHGRGDSNLRPPPCTYPPLPPHLTFTYVYIGFWFPTYYSKPSLSWLFEVINELKWKNVTIKLYNFLRSTTFILVVSPSKVVYEIWISNLINSNVLFLNKMILNQKVVNYKVS